MSEICKRCDGEGKIAPAPFERTTCPDCKGTGRAPTATGARAEPDCAECDHPALAHYTLHAGGCIGRPGGPCGPDCSDPCGVDGCLCRTYIPAAPASPPVPAWFAGAMRAADEKDGRAAAPVPATRAPVSDAREPRGTYACPICGRDTPHYHEPALVEKIRALEEQVADCLTFIDAALADRDYYERLAETTRATTSEG